MNRSAAIIENLTSASLSGGPVWTFPDQLRQWHHRHRTRQQLKRLDGRQLADLGLSEIERRAEYRKWFWQK